MKGGWVITSCLVLSSVFLSVKTSPLEQDALTALLQSNQLFDFPEKTIHRKEVGMEKRMFTETINLTGNECLRIPMANGDVIEINC